MGKFKQMLKDDYKLVSRAITPLGYGSTEFIISICDPTITIVGNLSLLRLDEEIISEKAALKHKPKKIIILHDKAFEQPCSTLYERID